MGLDDPTSGHIEDFQGFSLISYSGAFDNMLIGNLFHVSNFPVSIDEIKYHCCWERLRNWLGISFGHSHAHQSPSESQEV